MTVIKLETEAEDEASWELSKLIQKAIDTSEVSLISYLRKLWDNESWESIVEKFGTEGSTWYVWWMDGWNACLYAGSFGGINREEVNLPVVP